MKRIVHLCVDGTYTDGRGYQENLIAKYHVRMGYEVTLICSRWKQNDTGSHELDSRTDYTNENGVHVIRLPMRGGEKLRRKLKRFEGLGTTLDSIAPDILFIHGAALADAGVVVRYCRQHPQTVVYADNHADFTNSGRNWLSKNILHGMIWKYYAHRLEPYVRYYYGVMPSRVDFLTEVYGLPKEKCRLLVMGADDELVAAARKKEVRERVREQYGIAEGDFLLMTGGKIDRWKTQTLLLMQAVQSMEADGVKLIVFGSVAPELKEQLEALTDGRRVQYIGWIQADDSYQYFAAADLVVFPGRHSVFWEQVAAQGIPMLVKDWPGTHHVDLGGNTRFIGEDSVAAIKREIETIYNDRAAYSHMLEVARNEGMKQFSYLEISKRAIEYQAE